MAGMTTNCCSPCHRRRPSSCPSRFRVWVWPRLEKSPASETCCCSKRTVGRVNSLPLDGIPFEKGGRPPRRCRLGVYQFEPPHDRQLSPCSELFLSRRRCGETPAVSAPAVFAGGGGAGGFFFGGGGAASGGGGFWGFPGPGWSPARSPGGKAIVEYLT